MDTRSTETGIGAQTVEDAGSVVVEKEKEKAESQITVEKKPSTDVKENPSKPPSLSNVKVETPLSEDKDETKPTEKIDELKPGEESGEAYLSVKKEYDTPSPYSDEEIQSFKSLSERTRTMTDISSPENEDDEYDTDYHKTLVLERLSSVSMVSVASSISNIATPKKQKVVLKSADEDDKRSITTESVTPAEKSFTSGGKSVTPGERSVTSGRRSVTPGERSVTSGGKSVTSERKSVTPGEGSVTSGRKSGTSERKSGTPGEKGVPAEEDSLALSDSPPDPFEEDASDSDTEETGNKNDFYGSSDEYPWASILEEREELKPPHHKRYMNYESALIKHGVKLPARAYFRPDRGKNSKKIHRRVTYGGVSTNTDTKKAQYSKQRHASLPTAKAISIGSNRSDRDRGSFSSDYSQTKLKPITLDSGLQGIREFNAKMDEAYQAALDKHEEVLAERERNRMRKLMRAGLVRIQDIKDDGVLLLELKREKKRKQLLYGWIEEKREQGKDKMKSHGARAHSPTRIVVPTSLGDDTLPTIAVPRRHSVPVGGSTKAPTLSQRSFSLSYGSPSDQNRKLKYNMFWTPNPPRETVRIVARKQIESEQSSWNSSRRGLRKRGTKEMILCRFDKERTVDGIYRVAQWLLGK